MIEGQLVIRTKTLAVLVVATYLVVCWVDHTTLCFAQSPDDALPQAPASDEEPAANDGQTASAEAAGPTDSLASAQEQLANRYRHFEAVILRMAELTAAEDPRRAALLRRVVAESRSGRVLDRLDDLTELLKRERLADASSSQDELATDLVQLLELLLSEERGKRLKDERLRLKEQIRKLNELINRQLELEGQASGGADLKSLAPGQRTLSGDTARLAEDMRASEEGDQDSGSGTDKPPGSEDSKENSRSPDGQSPDGESPSDNSPTDKAPPDESEPGKSASGKSPAGKSPSGKSAPGDKSPRESSPGKSSPSESPSETPPGDSPSGESPPSESQPGDSQNSPSKSSPSQGNPTPNQQGSPGQSQDQSPQDQPPAEGNEQPAETARKRVLEARQKMDDAQQALERAEREGATKDQEEARRKLEEAKAQLEEILRQLREEEVERVLAMLEARFRKMLEMQLVVYEGTKRLDQIPSDALDRDLAIEAGRLSRDEAAIGKEAAAALTLMREDGTAVAFPEAVEQLQADIAIVVQRLATADVGSFTQGVEEEIIAAIEEMISALEKAQDELEKQKQNPQMPSDGQPSEPPLVDVLSELKMVRALQLRVNRRTERYAKIAEADPAKSPSAEIKRALADLAGRQERIYKATKDIAAGKNQ